MKDYSKLIDLIGKIESTESFGERVHSKTDDGVTPLPYVEYDQVVYDFCETMTPFTDYNYLSNLKDKYGLEARYSIYSYDVSDADENCIFTFCTTVIRGDRFCEGVLLAAFEEGHVLRWLKRLEELAAHTSSN